jgi:hypothetical protein
MSRGTCTTLTPILIQAKSGKMWEQDFAVEVYHLKTRWCDGGRSSHQVGTAWEQVPVLYEKNRPALACNKFLI